MFFAILTSVAFAGFDIEVKNKTAVEVELYRNYRPYISSEITVGRAGFTLEDPNGFATVNGNKVAFGFKYPSGEWITLDPHWYVEHLRQNHWALLHGPALRIDARF